MSDGQRERFMQLPSWMQQSVRSQASPCSSRKPAAYSFLSSDSCDAQACDARRGGRKKGEKCLNQSPVKGAGEITETHRSTELCSTVWTLAYDTQDGGVAARLSLELATLLGGHDQRGRVRRWDDVEWCEECMGHASLVQEKMLVSIASLNGYGSR